MNSHFITPTTELDAVNCMLSGIGESPINSLSTPLTNDVGMAKHILMEVTRDIQLEGFQWNTEDNYPLTASFPHGLIQLPPQVIRVHFREPDHKELTIRGGKVYDRLNHTHTFTQGTQLHVTVTLLLEFMDMPEAARRYTTLKALRIFQQRVLGSDTLSSFHAQDEARARASLMADERMQDQPNILTGTYAPVGTWQVHGPLYRGRSGGW